MAAAAALALSACSFSDDDREALDQVVERTTAEGTARVRSRLTYGRPGSAGMTGYGSFDLRNRRGRTVFRVSDGMTEDALVDGDTAYTRFGRGVWIRLEGAGKACWHGDPVGLAKLPSASEVERPAPGEYTGVACDMRFLLREDEQGRVLRLRYVDLANNTVTFDFVRFGVPVEVEAPKRSITPKENQEQLSRELRKKCGNPDPSDLALCNLFSEDELD
jgi:hypothetical protein